MTAAAELSFDTFDPSAELDYSKAGFSTPRVNWTITEAKVEQASNRRGAGMQAVIEFTAEVDGRTLNVTQRAWLAHEDAQQANIGHGTLKRIFLSANGQPKGNVPGLLGKMVSAEGYEDDQGFRRLGRMQAATVATSQPGPMGL